jgi:hypothetical protein
MDYYLSSVTTEYSPYREINITSARIGVLCPFCNLKMYAGGLNRWLEALYCNQTHDLHSAKFKINLQLLINIDKFNQDVKSQLFR